MQNMGFVYEETSGMYYDYNTGYYYNAVSLHYINYTSAQQIISDLVIFRNDKLKSAV